ncbi:hypothetical protein ACH46_18905 [Gordonia phthalatica]|uniref:HTH tetR-type domain-containing protein n=1 Tax=Gordonia phthalatica TaxID=1136941 RepID=A0A0N9NH04_9ACTN|nr:hypothetical protein ACH46_18905 [Gordonia phthalatica]
MAVEDRRQLLIDAAWRVLVRDGLANLTTRSVAAEAQMPQGAFHYCFSSKDELLTTLVSGAVAELGEHSAHPVAPGDADLHSILRDTIDALWRRIVAPPEKQLALYELTVYAVRNGATDLPASQYRGYFAAATRLLDAVADAAEVTWTAPTDSLARLIVSVIDGVGLTWLTDHDDEAAQRVLALLVSQLESSAINR